MLTFIQWLLTTVAVLLIVVATLSVVVLTKALRDSSRENVLQAKVDSLLAQAKEWAALAPEDDWGDTPTDTMKADIGRYIISQLSEEHNG